MLSDRVQMYAYFNAVFEDKHHFKDKVVLDVGAGSGILAVWSAQSGAKKVYAVEATKMWEHACEIVNEDNLQHVVEVIEGSMEDVTLPEKVEDACYGSTNMEFGNNYDEVELSLTFSQVARGCTNNVSFDVDEDPVFVRDGADTYVESNLILEKLMRNEISA